MDFGSIGSAIGGVVDLANQWGTNLFNMNQAKVAWNRTMNARATAYQTAVADMRAAGLNPLLAAQQGPAPTPSAHEAPAASVPSMSSAVASARQASQRDRELGIQEQHVANEAKAVGQDVKLKSWQEERGRAALEPELQEVWARSAHSLASAAKLNAEIPGARAYSQLIEAIGTEATTFIKAVKKWLSSPEVKTGVGDFVYEELSAPGGALDKAYRATPAGMVRSAAEWAAEQLEKAVNSARAQGSREARRHGEQYGKGVPR